MVKYKHHLRPLSSSNVTSKTPKKNIVSQTWIRYALYETTTDVKYIH
jgi:hypothetical protein